MGQIAQRLGIGKGSVHRILRLTKASDHNPRVSQGGSLTVPPFVVSSVSGYPLTNRRIPDQPSPSVGSSPHPLFNNSMLFVLLLSVRHWGARAGHSP